VRIAAPDTPWTITLATAMVLIVTDGLQQGDESELFDFGASIGSTSANANNVFTAAATTSSRTLRTR